MTGDRSWTPAAMRAAQRCLSAVDSDLDIRALHILLEAVEILAQAITALENEIETRIAQTPLEKPQ